MIWIGVDAHKRVHQGVALRATGVVAQNQIANSAAGWAELRAWAAKWPDRTWAIEGSASYARGLAQFRAELGERVHEVSPEMDGRAATNDLERTRSGRFSPLRMLSGIGPLIVAGLIVRARRATAWLRRSATGSSSRRFTAGSVQRRRNRTSSQPALQAPAESALASDRDDPIPYL